MRLRRSHFELACRVGVFALIGWLLGASLIPSSGRRTERATGAEMEARLAAWTREPSSVSLHGEFDTTPSAWAVDWLAALQHSGHVVTWSGAPTPIALSADPLTDPAGGARIDVAAPAGATVTVRDEASLIDSITVSNFGGSVRSEIIVGSIVATANGESARVAAPDSTPVRAIVVLGGASWEGKFIVAALEERGWPVLARFTVAPNVAVGERGGAPVVLDTSRVAAVIAVDTMLQGVGGRAALERYVRSGGGLILAGTSGLASPAAGLAPAGLGARFRPAVLPADTLALGSTGFYPLAPLRDDAVALDRRQGGVAVAARRVGAGRVIQVGYDDSWRWRMAGAAGSENAHRAWWGALAAAVAYVPPSATLASMDDGDGAPVARLVDRVGPARAAAPSSGTRAPVDRRIIVALIMLLLLAEWASRRLRGFR